MLKFTITQYISDYIKVGDEYKHVEVKCDYECHNWDDLENLLLTLVCNKNDIKLRIKREGEVD